MPPIVKRSWKSIAFAIFCLVILFGTREMRTRAASGVNVTTYHNDNARTGQNLSETTLNTSNVNVNTFGQLLTIPVDGYVYAEPLYVPNVNVSGQGSHNLLFVATEHDSAFAFDADTGQQLWTISFIDPAKGITTLSSANDIGCGDLVPEVGITGTPVIDPVSLTAYLVVNTKENGVFFQRLHALNLTTGSEIAGSPVVIQATVSGTGEGSVNGKVSFDPLKNNQRSALMLQNGVIEIVWASHCDIQNYHGWLMAYNEQSLKQLAVWNTTPNGGLGGIWQGGSGPAADSSYNTYFATGNGTFDANTAGKDFGDSVIRLPFSKDIRKGDYFTPYNQANLSNGDIDLGAGGVVLLPDNPGGPNAHLLVQSGKEGSMYLINRDDMGHYNPNNNDQIVQFIPYVMGGIWGTGAWWNNSVYFSGQYDAVKQFAFNTSTGLLSTSPVSQSATSYGYPGPEPSISANGNSDAILWMIDSSAYSSSGSEVMHAFDATNLATELYNTNQNAQRDNAGGAVKFIVPTVANGKVYAGAAYQVSVYGLLP